LQLSNHGLVLAVIGSVRIGRRHLPRLKLTQHPFPRFEILIDSIERESIECQIAASVGPAVAILAVRADERLNRRCLWDSVPVGRPTL
jgi:hypothetical protein